MSNLPPVKWGQWDHDRKGGCLGCDEPLWDRDTRDNSAWMRIQPRTEGTYLQVDLYIWMGLRWNHYQTAVQPGGCQKTATTWANRIIRHVNQQGA